MPLVYDRISSNRNKTIMLMALFVVIIIIIGYVLGAVTGLGFSLVAFAFIIAILGAIFSYYYSDSVALAISHAQPADEKKYILLHNTVENMAIASGLPKPKVYVIEDSAINAFATGRNPQNAAIAVTTGALEKLNRIELEGVVGHEMSHIKNRDILVMTITVVLVGIIMILSDIILRAFFYGGFRGKSEGKGGLVIIALIAVGFLLAIISPILAQVIKAAISRKREYLADADSALLTRYPDGLASALEKIKNDKKFLGPATKATAHLYISNPFKNKASWFYNLFDTHPPIEERIKILREM